jgi:energy-coupling factor transporter ATP-binding protein EcfA2
MNQHSPGENNNLLTPPLGIQQQVKNSTVHGEIVAVQGNNNVFTFNRTEILQIAVEEIKTRELKKASPYKGLKTFEPKDKDLFFGRDQFLRVLVNELEQTNLILLLGASGSGKSSVVRAGLIPWLSQERGSRLVELVFTPDIDPFISFYTNLPSKYKQAVAQNERKVEADSLTQVVKKLKQPNDYWFIFIDQFEELFTTSDAQKRDQFIAGLVKLSQENLADIKIMATMRADFLDRLSPYRDLVKVTDKHRPLITELQRDELRLAIEQPAGQHGVVFETGLVEEITKDIQGQAGYLPLLQYTLDLLWQEEVKSGSINDRTLNITTYRSLGGVRGALQQRVDQIYDDLPPGEKLATQRIFLKLVGIDERSEPDTEWKPVRRRALRSEFSDEQEKDVLVRLINENLLVSDRLPPSQESTVEITHETLLTSWTNLNIWIKENRDSIALRNRLNDDVARWQASKAEDELWTGSKLELVLELRTDSTFNQVLGGFSPAANQFIDASLGLRERIKQRELRRRTVVVATISAAVLGAVGYGWWNSEKYWQLSLDSWSNWNQVNTSNSSSKLDFLKGAEAQALKDIKAGNVNRSLALYRQIRADSVEFLAKDINDQEALQKLLTVDKQKLPQPLQKLLESKPGMNELLEKSKNAEKLMVKLIWDNRRELLDADLRNERFGEVIRGTRLSDHEKQYTEGALKKTYLILIKKDFGAGADLNGNGRVDRWEEAYQIPCQLLIDLEKLWRSKGCSWYDSPDSPYSPTCRGHGLHQTALVDLIFADLNYRKIATEHIRNCRNQVR